MCVLKALFTSRRWYPSGAIGVYRVNDSEIEQMCLPYMFLSIYRRERDEMEGGGR